MNFIQTKLNNLKIKKNTKKNNDNQFIKLPNIIKFKIFRLLNQYDSIQLYKTCKDLNHIKYIVIDSLKCSEGNYKKLIKSRLIERSKEIEIECYDTYKRIIKVLENNKNNILLESFKLPLFESVEPFIAIYPKYLTKLVLEFWNNPNTSLSELPVLPDTIEDLELYHIGFSVSELNHKLLPKNLKRLRAPLLRVDQFVWDSTMTDLCLGEVDWSISIPSKLQKLETRTLTIDPETRGGFKFPSTLTKLSFVWNYYKRETLELDIDCLSSNLKYLHLHYRVSVNSKSTFQQYPSTLTHIINYRSSPIHIEQLQNLRVLVFDKYFNYEIQPHSLPSSIKELTFGSSFNRLLTADMLPPELEILTIDCSDIHLPRMPTSLKELYINQYSSFNQPIDQMGLESTQLTTLNFSNAFDHPLYDASTGRSYLPPTLRHLEICQRYNQSLQSIPPCVNITYNLIMSCCGFDQY